MPRLGEPLNAESLSREDVVWWPQAEMLIDDLVAQQMRADGEQRGVIEVGLIITWSRRHNAFFYGPMYSTGSCLIHLKQRFLRLARGPPYLWQRSLRFACGSWATSTSPQSTLNHVPWMLLYVRYSAALFYYTALLVRTTCTSFWIWLASKLLCIMYPSYYRWDFCMLNTASIKNIEQTYYNFL